MQSPSSSQNSVNPSTPMEVIAQVSRIVTRVVDRITGDRNEVPLMVAAATVEALKQYEQASQIMYGPAAWIEVLDDQTPVWMGAWGQHFHFWVATEFGEVVDLNANVAIRRRPADEPRKPLYAPPLLWSAEVPGFYRYRPEGVAELELHDERDIRQFETVLQEIREKCTFEAIRGVEPEFPNEAILCPGRRVLDDSNQSFRHFDRALAVHGLPPAPSF